MFIGWLPITGSKGIIHVHTILKQAPAGTLPSVAAAADNYFDSVSEIESCDPEMAGRYAAGTRGLGCIRGLRFIIAAEAVAGLMLYGLWHLWHVLR